MAIISLASFLYRVGDIKMPERCPIHDCTLKNRKDKKGKYCPDCVRPSKIEHGSMSFKKRKLRDGKKSKKGFHKKRGGGLSFKSKSKKKA